MSVFTTAVLSGWVDGGFSNLAQAATPINASVISPAPATIPAPSKIALWGDSLTSIELVTYINAVFPARIIYRGGVGGQFSTDVAARQGGVVIRLSLANDTIPPSGVVDITSRSASPITALGGTATGTINGIHGSLNRAANGSYAFTRDAAGASSTVAPNTPFIVDTFGRDTWPTVLWMGRNNFYDPVQVKKDIASSVAFLKSNPKLFLVLSILNAEGEIKGTERYTTLTRLNADLHAQYPNNFIDIRSYLVSQYDPSSPQDVVDFQNDVVPTSLRRDQVHLNTKGNILVGKKLSEFIQSKAW